MLNKTNKYQTLLAVCLLTLSACSTNETLTDSPIDQSKTPIELTVGIVGENTSTPRALTRTVITTDNPYGHAATAFAANTSLYMVLKSDYDGTGDAQAPLYSRSIGTVPGSGGENPLNVSFASGYQRYWEDSYSRDSKVSVYSACVPGKNTALTIGGSDSYNQNNYTWSTEAISPTIVWPMLSVSSPATQDASFLANQDLCFSNNVSGDYSIDFNSTNNQFNPRRMYFHHALTKVTFKIKRGDGFTGANFAFTESGKNIVLTGFYTSGTLDISTGVFSSTNTTTIDALSLTDHRSEASPTFDYELTGLMLPGSALTSTATNEVYFTIDNNKYHIKKSELAAALSDKTLTNTSLNALDEGSTMRPGVHYIFTMTVSKKKIDKLTASVVPWEVVEADEITPSNARISISLLTNGTKQTGTIATFDLYRSAYVHSTISDTEANYTWGTGYTSNKAQLKQNTTAGEYIAYVDATDPSTAWYWPDNKTFYHFRTVMPVNHTVTENTTTGDYISLTGAEDYTDVCWGAPFNYTTGNLTYHPTTYGFDGSASHQISKAIGPTTATINMNTFHMMSDVTFNLTTTDGTDAVTLTNAKMELVAYNTGRVLMGNGLVETTGSASTIENQSTGTPWHYGFVPQSLDPDPTNDADDVILIITTSDNNQYKVTLKNVEFTASSFNNNLIANPYTVVDGKCKINRWYPNFSYTYTFHLTKTGIEKVTATLAAWGAVTADPQTVVIQ